MVRKVLKKKTKENSTLYFKKLGKFKVVFVEVLGFIRHELRCIIRLYVFFFTPAPWRHFSSIHIQTLLQNSTMIKINTAEPPYNEHFS